MEEGLKVGEFQVHGKRNFRGNEIVGKMEAWGNMKSRGSEIVGSNDSTFSYIFMMRHFVKHGDKFTFNNIVVSENDKNLFPKQPERQNDVRKALRTLRELPTQQQGKMEFLPDK